MRERAHAMLEIAEILDRLCPEDSKAVSHEMYRTYGGPLTPAERAARYRERAITRHEIVTASRDAASRNGVIPGLYVSSTSSLTALEAVEASTTGAGAREAHDKAKALLKAGDYEFLRACPEPFCTAWLDGEWWLSLIDGYPKIDHRREASKCMAFVQGKYSAKQIAKLHLRERLRRWMAKADWWRENKEERKEIRRT